MTLFDRIFPSIATALARFPLHNWSEDLCTNWFVVFQETAISLTAAAAAAAVVVVVLLLFRTTKDVDPCPTSHIQFHH